MRVLWVVIKSSLATCSVNSAFSSEQSLGLCADPSKLTRRFIQLFSKGPHSWAYSQEGKLVFQWISLSIWMRSGWNMAPAEGRPWVMNSFVFCHIEDQMLEAARVFSTAREMISFGCHRWWILWVYPPFSENHTLRTPVHLALGSVNCDWFAFRYYSSCESTQKALIQINVPKSALEVVCRVLYGRGGYYEGDRGVRTWNYHIIVHMTV